MNRTFKYKLSLLRQEIINLSLYEDTMSPQVYIEAKQRLRTMIMDLKDEVKDDVISETRSNVLPFFAPPHSFNPQDKLADILPFKRR